jgi:chitodextrinase
VYSSGATYVGGDKVVFEGKEYRAKWWTRGDNPSYGGVWNLVRPCNTDGSSVTNQVCGGISAWSPTATYSGGALVHHKNVIYKAKWWSRGGDIETADSWSKQSECAKVEAAVATSPQGLQSDAPAAVALLGVDNIVNVEAESEATSFTVYLSVLLEGIQAGKTAADLEVIEGSLVGVLEVQYGIFVPKNSIKDVVFKDQGPGTVSLVAELHFPSLHAAEDAQAVMSEYEADVRETIKSIAKSRAGVDVETVSFDGTSVVAEGISVNLDVVNGVGSVLPSFLYMAIASLIVMVL